MPGCNGNIQQGSCLYPRQQNRALQLRSKTIDNQTCHRHPSQWGHAPLVFPNCPQVTFFSWPHHCTPYVTVYPRTLHYTPVYYNPHYLLYQVVYPTTSLKIVTVKTHHFPDYLQNALHNICLVPQQFGSKFFIQPSLYENEHPLSGWSLFRSYALFTA